MEQAFHTGMVPTKGPGLYEFTEAVGDVYFSALIELGLILFLITTIVLAISKLLLLRLARHEGAKT